MVVDWPEWLQPSEFYASPESNVSIRTAVNGAIATSQLPGMRWIHQVVIPPDASEDRRRAEIEAFFATIEGQANRVRMWHLKRPVPEGTMRGSPTSGGALRGARFMTINAGPGETLLHGDVIGITTAAGLQRVMVNAAETVGSTISCAFAGPLQANVSAGSPVVWNRPATLFMLRQPYIPIGYGAGANPSISVELVEMS
jgi:hypothetical protein